MVAPVRGSEAMNPHGLFLQKAEDERHAVLRWDAQTQVNVVGHRMPFQHLNATLTSQIPQDGTDLPPQPSVEDFLAVSRYDHDEVLTVPTDMGQALPLVHKLLLLPRGAFPEGRAYAFSQRLHAGSLEALRVSRPEAVALAVNKQK